MNNKIIRARLCLKALTIYRGLLSDDIINKLALFLDYIAGEDSTDDGLIERYSAVLSSLLELNPVKGLRDYILEKVLLDENPFTRECERTEFDSINPILKNAARADFNNLQIIGSITSQDIKAWASDNNNITDTAKLSLENLLDWNFDTDTNSSFINPDAATKLLIKLKSSELWGNCLCDLACFIRKNGSGELSKYRAFVWERREGKGYLKNIDNPDKIRLSELIGYVTERSDVINNTLQFIKGFPANNLLLYGDRGTGKSSTVKAILNEYYEQGLRIIEVPKNLLVDFPQIISKIKDRGLKFILFVDDLAFEDNEESYTALKAVLEGSMEVKPANLLIYATSNRRHLIKEKFSDRAGLIYGTSEDEVRAADTIQEKLSLSDRFGMTVIFSSPDKYRYLEIVDGLVAQRNIPIDKETLHKEALKWELWYNGRSPRTARQFIDWLEGRVILNPPSTS